ncbi:Metallo-dependent phosphatase [Pyrenochaeta sp. DS3sAY3a]|nr:Metallo-dependent phosphatase [Pyrenochaeta sp. DS3sAY3a]
MTYRDYPHAQNSPPRLIDLIPDRQLVDVSDEEDGFYGRDDDFLIPPKWQAAITHTTDRIPRRIKRHSAAILAITLLLLASWVTYFGPQYSKHKQELRDMDSTPAMSYGSNVRPEFKGMIQVSDMDQQHLPKRHNRLVFVGDVHGCREELEHLLEKIDFKHKHDHLVLTGDIITKGPDSPGVVRLAQKLGASCVRGNWEDKFLLSIAAAHETSDEDALHDDLVQPESNRKLRKLAKKFHKSDIAFLQQCPVILRVGSVPNLGSLVVVHAGLVPDVSLKHQDPFHVMNMRTIDLKTHIPSSKHDGTPWETFWNHRQKRLPEQDRTTVIYGHNRKRGLNIQDYTYGLDTGCAAGGRLTALVVDGHGKTEIVHVNCKNAMGYNEED